MTAERRPRITLIQTLVLLALIGTILTVGLPRWLDRGGDSAASLDSRQGGEAGRELDD